MANEKRRRRAVSLESSKERWYFTQEHEDAINEYVRNQDLKVRSRLYKEFIGPVFSEMVDKIACTYKFGTTLPNIASLREECKIWLVTVLDKYDKDSGSKAFTYFSVITKNWFIQRVKKENKTKCREYSIDSDDDMHRKLEERLSENHLTKTYEQTREFKEFFDTLKDEIDNWQSNDVSVYDQLSEEEIIVAKAIKALFDEIDNIEIFNKKAVYVYLRELTGMKQKRISLSLKKIKDRYKYFKHRWEIGVI